MDYYTFIADMEELKFFFDNILPSKQSLSDVYFLSLSARKKYLTEEERKEFVLGSSEMFNKTIIREKDWLTFLRTIRRFECHKEGYITADGKSYPQKCITCYININTSNSIQALFNFKKVLAEYEAEIASIAFSDRASDNIEERLNGLVNNFLTEYQKSRGEKYWIDIDLDVCKEFEPNIKDYLNKKGVKTFWVIDTKSGYHILIKKDELKFNPQDITSFIKEQYAFFCQKKFEDSWLECFDKSEIVINKNDMIQIPGTYQGGYPVRIIR